MSATIESRITAARKSLSVIHAAMGGVSDDDEVVRDLLVDALRDMAQEADTELYWITKLAFDEVSIPKSGNVLEIEAPDDDDRQRSERASKEKADFEKSVKRIAGGK